MESASADYAGFWLLGEMPGAKWPTEN